VKPRLAVSAGDPAGIGPEITLAAAARGDVRRACDLVVYGDPGVLAKARGILGLAEDAPTAIREIVPVSNLRRVKTWWRPSVPAGQAAFDASPLRCRNTGSIARVTITTGTRASFPNWRGRMQ
jgi:4-hydroxy-L-threonine phosphate dehydrogenase PdxA